MRLVGSIALGAAAALAVPAAAAPAHRAPARHAPVARDWSRTVVATPEGGFRMGNPAARVKLVEYGSLTCPHCRHFAQTGVQPLVQRYVRTGKLSYEFRNYILNGIDAAASLIARCSGARFFDTIEAFYATQPQWIAKVTGLTAAQKAELQAAPEAQRLVRIGSLSGLVPMAARFGVAPQRAAQCLASKPGLDRLGAMEAAANALGVSGTPTFFINGRITDAGEWEQLEPLIKAAGG